MIWGGGLKRENRRGFYLICFGLKKPDRRHQENVGKGRGEVMVTWIQELAHAVFWFLMSPNNPKPFFSSSIQGPNKAKQKGKDQKGFRLKKQRNSWKISWKQSGWDSWVSFHVWVKKILIFREKKGEGFLYLERLGWHRWGKIYQNEKQILTFGFHFQFHLVWDWWMWH